MALQRDRETGNMEIGDIVSGGKDADGDVLGTICEVQHDYVMVKWHRTGLVGPRQNDSVKVIEQDKPETGAVVTISVARLSDIVKEWMADETTTDEELNAYALDFVGRVWGERIRSL